MDAVELTGRGLSASDVVAVARDGAAVRLAPIAVDLMTVGADAVQRALHAPEPAYGVSTGFGSLANVVIPAERREELQRALVRSHAAGMGPPVEREVVRAMMLLRARTLAMGYSGVRPVVAERILALLNAGLTPVVPEHGSLGASGDLAPLAHCALVLLGEGEVQLRDGTRADAATALADAGIEPLTLIAKEGLALINGTDGMLGMLVLAAHDLTRLLRTADVTAAMSVEALLGTDRAFAADLVALRPQPGQQASAANLRALLAGSAIVLSHRYGDDRVQDAYSLRCAPQVAGAARDVLAHAVTRGRRGAAQRDRQPDGAAGRPRRVVRQLPRRAAGLRVRRPRDRGRRGRRDRRAPHGPPARRVALERPAAVPRARRGRELRPDARAVHAGVAGRGEPAARVAGERRLAADERDAGGPRLDGLERRRASCASAIANLARILAIELVCAARAIELREPLQPAAGTAAAVLALRAAGVPGAGPDRWLVAGARGGRGARRRRRAAGRRADRDRRAGLSRAARQQREP